ncbi:DNA sulfur modification protein DndB [Streptomyces sp. HSG2]|uniref:DNA sulfur modification protein DndB n=1 Tax=Streptomyces sp. HSG2 TaxID=2797167 RepID=UPI001F5BA2F7|nr:DNA sulfur modification protein DndB [Streptomyces sp. HSG2]
MANGVIDCENLLAIVNDPQEVEDAAKRAQKAGRPIGEYARTRAGVQRLLGTAGSKKAKNVGEYADYIAAGLRGDYDEAWSLPQITLWSPRPLMISEEGSSALPIKDGLYVLDSETQVTAWHRIKSHPGAYDLSEDFDFGAVPLSFEIFHGIGIMAARQIFHDRNMKGVPVDKSLAMSMDGRDFGTTVTRKLMESLKVPVGETTAQLSSLILTGKRQVSDKAAEWMTMSVLRTFIATAMLGKAGIHAASTGIEHEDIPVDESGTRPDRAVVQREVMETMGAFLQENAQFFHSKTAITAPAVVAGLGATINRCMSWSTDPLTDGVTLERLLEDVKWEREAKYWSGIAAKVTDRGAVSWAGGARDSGHKVYDALNRPESEAGKQIRGRF